MPGDDASDFEKNLRVTGERVGKHRILRAKSPVVANAFAALLIDLEKRTGKVPHVYFKWHEGNPITNLFAFLILGEGDAAPLTHEVLRRAIKDPAHRPVVHVADTGPSARAGLAMTYDSARHRTVLFGGGNGPHASGDTWEWNGGRWTQVATTGPSPRSAPSLAYDKARGKAVLFGGTTDVVSLQDTWEWMGDQRPGCATPREQVHETGLSVNLQLLR